MTNSTSSPTYPAWVKGVASDMENGTLRTLASVRARRVFPGQISLWLRHGLTRSSRPKQQDIAFVINRFPSHGFCCVGVVSLGWIGSHFFRWIWIGAGVDPATFQLMILEGAWCCDRKGY